MRIRIPACISMAIVVLLLQSVFAGVAAKNNDIDSHSGLYTENIFIHTARDIYFSGDMLDFKAYVQRSNAMSQTYRPGKVMYFSLFSPDGKPVVTMELTLNNGDVFGSVLLPDTLQTGFYGMAAWTNTMLIEKAPHYFKQFLVINRFDDGITDFIHQNRLLPFGGGKYQDSLNGPVEPAGQGMAKVHHESAMAFFDPILNEIVHLTTEPEYMSRGFEIQAEKKVYGTDEMVQIQFGVAHAGDSIVSASLSVSRKEAMFVHEGAAPDLVIHPGNNGTDAWPVSLVIPEIYGPILSGLVIDVDKQESVKDAVVLLSAVDTLANLKYFKSLQDGSFYFLLEPYHQGKTLYLSLLNNGEAKASQQILVRNKFNTKRFIPGKRVFDDGIQTYLSEALTMKRIQRVYRNTASSTAASSNGASSNNQALKYAPLLFNQPSHTVRPEDYLPFDDLISLANEIVPNLRLRGRPDDVVAGIIHPQTRSIITREPAFFMNGVYVPDLKRIISLASKDITSIQVVNTPWMYGDLEFGGIVALFNDKKLLDIPHHPGYAILKGSLDMHTLFSANGATPNNGQEDTHSPGFSETIVWQPELSNEGRLPQSFSFMTGDLPGEYVVVMKGITLTGKPVLVRSSIYVK